MRGQGWVRHLRIWRGRRAATVSEEPQCGPLCFRGRVAMPCTSLVLHIVGFCFKNRELLATPQHLLSHTTQPGSSVHWGEGAPLLSAGSHLGLGYFGLSLMPQLLILPLGSEPRCGRWGTLCMSTDLPPMGTGPGSASSASTPAGTVRLAPRENPRGRAGGLRQPSASLLSGRQM